MRSLDRAIDCVVVDPRGVEPLYSHNSDKKALAAATAAEEVKAKQHRERVREQGLGMVNFEVVPFAFESSGAWGVCAQKLWSGMKKRFKDAGCEYFLDSSRPRTWSAFTAFQWYPQRISFAVAKLTARLVLRGVKASSARGRISPEA